MRLLERQNPDEFLLTGKFYNDVPRYAILSHTWGLDDEEVTFDDLAREASKGIQLDTEVTKNGEVAIFRSGL